MLNSLVTDKLIAIRFKLNEIWKCWFVRREENHITQGKTGELYVKIPFKLQLFCMNNNSSKRANKSRME